MRILIISDTHGRHSGLQYIMRLASYDMVFHLGDSQGKESTIREICGKIPVHMVRGNCDGLTDLEDELELDIQNNKILLTHGHLYHVKRNTDELIKKAKSIEAGYVFFGHTHTLLLEECEGITLANPGSLAYAKSEKGSTYMVADVDDSGKIHISVNYLSL